MTSGGGTSGTGATGGTGGTTGNIIPKVCSEAHGSVGCCGSNNEIYYWECGKLQGGPGSCNGNPCGWDPVMKYYSCGGTGFTGSDPSGKYPRSCGGTNPDPTGCPGKTCMCQGNCGKSSTPYGCACDSACVAWGDCCADACPACGYC